LIGLPLIVIPAGILGQKVRKHGRGSLERLADLTDAMSQMFQGIRIVKAFKMEDAESAEFHAINRRYLKRVMRMIAARGASTAITEGVHTLGFVVILMLGSVAIQSGRVDLPALCGVVVSLACMVRPVRRLTKSYNILQESMAGGERIFEILDYEPAMRDADDAVDLPGIRQGIEFQNVSFAYDTELVLRNISFSVPQGHVLAVVGESGAGKSTLLDLIPRFYDPVEGAVLIDGIDLRKIRRDSLLDHVAIVSQQPFLFNRSIRDNIRYGRPSAADKDVAEAARIANIHDFIVSLPEGYDTLAGEYGARLSGGQRQRITIARAILKDPAVLLLDEATSSLDLESERLVQEALANLMKGRTTFVIAHRLSTVCHADKIIVLHDGEIVGEGTHESLLKTCAEYQRLYHLQFAG